MFHEVLQEASCGMPVDLHLIYKVLEGYPLEGCVERRILVVQETDPAGKLQPQLDNAQEDRRGSYCRSVFSPGCLDV